MESEYSTLDIVKILKIPRERLREWITRGFVKPSIQEAKGQGTKALFSITDVYLIALFRYLLKTGIKREAAAEIIGSFDRYDPFIKSPYLVYQQTDKGGTTMVINPTVSEYLPDMVAAAMRDGVHKINHILIINFGKIKGQIDADILNARLLKKI